MRLPSRARTAHFHAVEYDWDKAARLALANGRPDWVRPLRTGRVGPPDSV